jgi:hypothetical protein
VWNVEQDQYKCSVKDNFFAFEVCDYFIHDEFGLRV